MQNNLRNYLSEFRIISDEFSIYNGKVINFGVVFEVIAHRHANKQDVKLRCINKVIDSQLIRIKIVGKKLFIY